MNERNRICKICILAIIFLSSIAAPAIGSEKILVSTNRYVILDDPISGTAYTAGGFANPFFSYTGWTYWTGNNTRINATALFIDDSGSPLSGRIITFNLYQPNGTEYTAAKINATTNAYGLANFSFDMNARNYYGNWTVKASNGSIKDNSSFIYNWWGCAYNAGTCDNDHNGDTPEIGGTINSPYTSGREQTVPTRSTHTGESVNCTWCHQSYDGTSGDTNPATGDVKHRNVASDVHRNITCSNVNCHNTLATHTDAVISSCYTSVCHTPSNRSDISNKSTLNGVVSIYSSNNGSTFNSTFHTPNSTVPCFICHGPMHNISKPDDIQRFLNNTDTESSHCTTCHTSYSKHNNSVNCNLCHSDDVHVIQVFAQNGTYVTGKTNSARGNCTNCHQNSTFITTLKSQADAGSYTGRDPPAIQGPVKHSDDPLSGAKWNQNPGYWTNTSQVTWCQYCHGNTSHSAAALGGPFDFKGNNLVNSSISTSTSWCISCHMQGYSSGSSSYSDMVNNFTGSQIPPEITGDPTYGANKSNSAYFNHTTVDKNDATCRGCHMTLNTGTTMTLFMHNVTIGKTCQDCHYSWSLMNGSYNKPLSYVNSTLVNASVHANVSCMNCHTYIAGHPDNSTYPAYGWKWCEDCHANTQDPLNNKSRHLIVDNPWNNLFGGISAVNITDCTTCHNSTLYDNSKNNFGEDKGIDCDYCHSFPDNSRG
ncbi:MAG TPA: hypothetical protein VER35_02215 [Candidatus Limnocylindrales bacterium]|nr:hypothetical protein [Candidatus Limnocylindrales bacterium]